MAMAEGPTKNSLMQNAQNVRPQTLSFSVSPPSTFSPPQAIATLHRRYSLSAEGKSLWATVMGYKFVTTEKDEHLIHRARQVQLVESRKSLNSSCTGNTPHLLLWISIRSARR
jgi:hypothetical protein